MNSRIIREDQLKRFESELEQAERSPATIEKYLRDVGAFAAWLAGRR